MCCSFGCSRESGFTDVDTNALRNYLGLSALSEELNLNSSAGWVDPKALVESIKNAKDGDVIDITFQASGSNPQF